MNISDFKNHIFDLDGTIANSMGHWARTMLSIVDDAKVPYPEDIIKQITPLGDRGIAKYFIALGVKGSEESIIERMHEIAYPKYRDIIEAKDGVLEYIKALNKKGCKLFVLTASPHLLLDPCLERYGIFQMFERTYSCDDLGLSKSNPEIYKKLCQREGIEIGETAFYDDNVIALENGKLAGLYTCGVYDASSDEYKEKIRETADKYITSFTELI
ncbi:MAG: HAD family phosphatase [Clostridia bacterium]|nr:HAD family phosphatase [Clostridia bacterium]